MAYPNKQLKLPSNKKNWKTSAESTAADEAAHRAIHQALKHGLTNGAGEDAAEDAGEITLDWLWDIFEGLAIVAA